MPGDPLAPDPAPAPAPSGPESDPSTVPLQAVPLRAPASPPLSTALTPLGLDHQGLLEAAAGTVIALIALFSSYDHITLSDRTISLQQQWGVWLIAASLALVLVDAQLATRSRLRAAHERAEARNRAAEERLRTDQERDRADQERNRAAEERIRAAERAERQGQGIARLHACALLAGRFQLDPSPANANRYRAVLALMADQAAPPG